MDTPRLLSISPADYFFPTHQAIKSRLFLETTLTGLLLVVHPLAICAA